MHFFDRSQTPPAAVTEIEYVAHVPTAPAFAGQRFVTGGLRAGPRGSGAPCLLSEDLKYLRALYDENAVPIQARRQQALAMERRLAELVNRAYGLTADEVDLLWSTAPPRMPVGR